MSGVRTLACVAMLISACFAVRTAGQTKHPLGVADLLAMNRVSGATLSPDGGWIAYTVTTCDLKANRTVASLWLCSADGATVRRLTEPPANGQNAAWSPDGKWIAFISTRSGKPEVWVVRPTGGAPRQFTNVSTEVSLPTWSPDGKWIAFVSDVLPEYSTLPFPESDALNARRLNELEHGPVRAQIFTHLLYRHWDKWTMGLHKHIFLQATGGTDSINAGGQPRDLTPGDRDAVPTSSTFTSGTDFAFSPDSKEVAYTVAPGPAYEEAWSTDHDIYVIPTAGGMPQQITVNTAADDCPRFSPDGNFIAYRAQAVPGFEADRWQLMLEDRSSGTITSLTKSFDGSVNAFLWAPDGKSLYFTAEERGNRPVFAVSTTGDDVRKILDSAVYTLCGVSSNGQTIYCTATTAVQPEEIFSATVDGLNRRQITKTNDALLAGLDIPPPESVWFDGAGGTKIQSWLFRPPAFDPARKYPLVYLVHGGPQDSWLNAWSYRWNSALWAAQGYVIMAPNPRGSTGFGQEFTNEISRDWGGRVYVDLMKGLDYAESLPYVERGNEAAAGASFGGYMMDWFLGHTGNRFKAIVTHDGVYNLESMYGSTEELWFPEWDLGGTPWDQPELYRKFSPSTFAKNFATPTLIIHSELDYRVPLSEGLQLFTALQRMGVPSKLLYFPDEGHLVLKPLNSELWHKTVFDWLATYLKK